MYIGAIDQGTTSTRFILFDHDGNQVAMRSAEHAQIYPRPGWVEHDPVEILTAAAQVAREVLTEAGIDLGQLAAVGIANQRETTVVWDKRTGVPVCNAIVWQDTRTDRIVQKLASEGGQDRFRQKVGLPLSAYFSGPKISWVLENIEGARADATEGHLLFGTIDSWLIWNLTGGVDGGVHVTDVSNASRTMLMGLESLDWDEEILETLGIPKMMLPEIRSSSEIYGHATGDLEGVAIAGDLGDQHAALFGQACFDPGDIKATYGTACNIDMNTGTEIVRSNSGLVTTVAYKIGVEPTVYALEGSIAITGALVGWLRDNLRMIASSSEIEKLASSVEDNGGVYLVPAFNGLYAPWWRDDARGIIVGLSSYVTNGHIARAALEATGWQTLDVLEAMSKDSGVELRSLKVDGGMVGNELLMQFEADVIRIPVVRPMVTEATALGAAYAAGLAVGFWGSTDELRSKWAPDKTWTPQLDPKIRDADYAQWKKAVSRTFGWIDIGMEGQSE